MEQRLIDANALKKHAYMERTGGGYELMVKWVAVKNAPTVDAVPMVKGLWIAERQIEELYHCSICGHVDHREPKHKYCPDCGAKMEGGE